VRIIHPLHLFNFFVQRLFKTFTASPRCHTTTKKVIPEKYAICQQADRGNLKFSLYGKNWTSWFEIPASDLDRAKAFYETLFGINMPVMDFGALKMAFFPQSPVCGAVCSGSWYKPGGDGVVIYLNANPDLAAVLSRVEAAGGKVLQAKKQISPEHGFMALFTDSEGNRIALHSVS
jgi:predicted enzyme related to lactoylglutathione lyase